MALNIACTCRTVSSASSTLPKVWLQVQADVAGIAAAGGFPPAGSLAQPPLQPLADGHWRGIPAAGPGMISWLSACRAAPLSGSPPRRTVGARRRSRGHLQRHIPAAVAAPAAPWAPAERPPRGARLPAVTPRVHASPSAHPAVSPRLDPPLPGAPRLPGRSRPWPTRLPWRGPAALPLLGCGCHGKLTVMRRPPSGRARAVSSAW
jgi:hypothetical protein